MAAGSGPVVALMGVAGVPGRVAYPRPSPHGRPLQQKLYNSGLALSGETPQPPAMIGLAPLAQAANRLTVGAIRDSKQDRAVNAAAVAALVCMRPVNPTRLQKADYVRVAEERGVEPWKLHGLTDIESRSGGFDNHGHAIMVPELHQFSKRTANAYDVKFPDLSIPKWIHPAKVKKGHPYLLDNLGRWDILARQAALNFDAAIASASWCAFQCMGFNFKKLNFNSPIELVQYLYLGERQQLDVAVRLLIADDGFEALVKGDYYRAAIVQNGTGKPKEYAADWARAANIRKGNYV